MKPLLRVNKAIIEQGLLCNLLLDARAKMLSNAHREAVEQHKPQSEVRMARQEADAKAIEMTHRTMRTRTFNEALQIVKEYVDIIIV